jgi:hypothetical protein
MFLTGDPGPAVVDFYKSGLAALGFRLESGGQGPDGETWHFRRDREAVTISTQYLPRTEDGLPSGAPPYGFIEKGRFEQQINAQYFFFVVTLRAP